jgi:hypothetical protein
VLSRVTSRAGRVVLGGAEPGGPEHELALVDANGAPLPPAGTGVRVTAAGAEYTLTLRPQAVPAKLVYTISEPATVDAPFTLHNVPLP